MGKLTEADKFHMAAISMARHVKEQSRRSDKEREAFLKSGLPRHKGDPSGTSSVHSRFTEEHHCGVFVEGCWS
jgi:hypothetical protein